MILQELDAYYRLLKKNQEGELPEMGFSSQKIHGMLQIDKSGKLIQLTDLREKKEKQAQPVVMEVPEPVKRTSNILPNFLWDNTGYVLGADKKKDQKKAREAFESFRKFHHKVGGDIDDDGMKAIIRFLDFWKPENAKKLEFWEELAGLNLVFRLHGDKKFIHQRPKLRTAWRRYQLSTSSGYKSHCLITGKHGQIARLHPSIKGVRGSQSSGASIVSFNIDAFRSYGKEQSFNAPISEEAVFTYTTALNHLLRFDSTHKVQIGDTTTVFWAEEKSVMENTVRSFFDTAIDKNEQTIRDVNLLLEAVRDGKEPRDIKLNIPFYILGLSPNAARISVRFWHVSSVGEMARLLGQHFQDLQIIKSFDDDQSFPGLRQLLRETAVLGKSDNISPLMEGALARAVLTGGLYPESLLSAVVTRIKSDRRINYLRASLLKGFLTRKYRILNKNAEVPMALDKNSTNVAYRLGMLFAVLEKIQRDANPNINTTIKDRFYGSASASPRAVMPQLIRLSQHHIKKAQRQAYHEPMIQNVLAGIEAFPPHLSLEEQGLFALGYYHQRKKFFTKKAKGKENEE